MKISEIKLQGWSKTILWVVAALVVLIILINWISRKIKAAKINESRKVSIDESKLTKAEEFYRSLALRLYSSMKGFQWSTMQWDERNAAWDALRALNDEEIRLVYNIFNSNYAKTPDTLTTWIKDEWGNQPIVGNPSYDLIIRRLDALGLA